MPNDEWHDRAAELRALAERMSNINTKRTMLLDWLKTTTNSATVRPSGREAAEPGYRRLFES